MELPQAFPQRHHSGSWLCAKCNKTFKEKHGCTQHIKLGRCKPRENERSRKRQTEATIQDPFLGRIQVSRKDGRYACPHGCGKSFPRPDYIPRHSQKYCSVTHQRLQSLEAGISSTL